jgi:hypothetical protein
MLVADSTRSIENGGFLGTEKQQSDKPTALYLHFPSVSAHASSNNNNFLLMELSHS